MLSSLSLLDDFFYRKPSVYVISDSQLAQYKRNQAEAEIIELDRLIDSHKQSIERLQTTRDLLRTDYPALAESSTTTTTENGEKS